MGMQVDRSLRARLKKRQSEGSKRRVRVLSDAQILSMLEGYADGKPVTELAASYEVSTRTVRYHVARAIGGE